MQVYNKLKVFSLAEGIETHLMVIYFLLLKMYLQLYLSTEVVLFINAGARQGYCILDPQASLKCHHQG
jgi:hypothetical protein